MELPHVEPEMTTTTMPGKPAEIIDRDDEWAVLKDVWERQRPDLMFVTGRRRIGKSFVLSRFVHQVNGVYYQATKRSEKEQLAGLSRVIGRHFDDDALEAGLVLPSWEALFEFITRRTKGAPFVFVIDEFPYLVEAAPALPSILQSLWDHDLQQTRMKLVLSGSYISAMTKLEAADQPLYGRRTAKQVFSPFSCRDASRFVPFYSAREKLVAYGTFGHLPGNLSLQDPERDLAANISSAILHPAGRLSDDAQHLLDAFLGDSSVYYSILEAVATGDHTWSRITNRVARSGGSLSRPLHWLEEMGLIERVAPITEKDPGKSKRSQYRVADPYVLFWHRIVAPLVNTGALGLVDPDRLWKAVVEPRIDDYMGSVFEQACRDSVRQGIGVPFEAVRVGEWWDASSTNQVDVVALSSTGEMLIGECKWGSITQRDLDLLRRRALMVASELDSQPSKVHLALFSGLGRTIRTANKIDDVLYVTGEQLVDF